MENNTFSTRNAAGATSSSCPEGEHIFLRQVGGGKSHVCVSPRVSAAKLIFSSFSIFGTLAPVSFNLFQGLAGFGGAVEVVAEGERPLEFRARALRLTEF